MRTRSTTSRDETTNKTETLADKKPNTVKRYSGDQWRRNEISLDVHIFIYRNKDFKGLRIRPIQIIIIPSINPVRIILPFSVFLYIVLSFCRPNYDRRVTRSALFIIL